MSKPIIGLLSCLLGLAACSPSRALPSQNPGPGLPIAQTSAIPSPQSPSPLAPQPSASVSPSTSAATSLPVSLPAGLAGLRIETGNRFLRGEGARTQFKAVLLDAAGQVLQADIPLQWQSSRPQDFSVDNQGQLLALVNNGYSDIQVSVPGTSFKASAVINVTSFGGGTSSTGPLPPNLSGISGTTLNNAKYVLIRDDVLTLSGSGFLPGFFSYQVLFGSTSATPLSVSDNSLTVRVPLGLNQAGDVVIRVVTQNISSNTLTGVVLGENLVINNGGFF